MHGLPVTATGGPPELNGTTFDLQIAETALNITGSARLANHHQWFTSRSDPALASRRNGNAAGNQPAVGSHLPSLAWYSIAL